MNGAEQYFNFLFVIKSDPEVQFFIWLIYYMRDDLVREVGGAWPF